MKAKRLISFAPKILRRLKSEAKKKDVSVSELVRTIIDGWLAVKDGVAQ